MYEDHIRRLILCINKIDGMYYDLSKANHAGENETAVLYALSDGREHSQKSICDEWLIPKTTINTLIHRMLNENLVEVTSLSGRKKMLKLTDKGKIYAKRALAPMHEAERAAMENTLGKFSPQFIDALENFAQYFIEYGERYGKRQ